MPKRTSHSAQIIEIKHSDGQFSFKPPTSTAASIPRRRQLVREIGEDLVSWVSTTRSKETERINTILQLIVELGDLSLHRGDAEEHTFGWQGRVFTAKLNMGRGFRPNKSDQEIPLVSKLNHLLLRYHLSPWYWLTIGQYPILGWWSRKNRLKDEDNPEEDVGFTEEDAVVAIIDLAREGLLCKIRRCLHCGDWFFASFTNQKFCHVRCQQDYYRSSEAYKAKRRAYMKNLRDLHKKTYPVSPKERARKARKGYSPLNVDGASSISRHSQRAKTDVGSLKGMSNGHF
jgi:hypothetical protein